MDTNRKDLTMHIKEADPNSDEFGFNEMYADKNKKSSPNSPLDESVDISEEEAAEKR